MTPLEAARDCLDRGWAPIPVKYRGKKPISDDWPNLRITRETAAEHFNGAKLNVGVLLGEPSGGLTDVDLDCPEALALAAGFLPPTGSIFGRLGKPGSHWLYDSAVPATVQYKDPGDGDRMLLELRSTGGQTVFPPSTHETGEAIGWVGHDEPLQVDAGRLANDTSGLAVACLLARAAPLENRHQYLLDITGALIRADRNAAGRIHHAVAWAILGKAYNEGEGDRLLAETAARIAKGDPACGWPRLTERVGKDRADKIAKWLEYTPGEAKPAAAAPPTEGHPWPAPLAPEAYYGIAGEIVRLIEPESESDPTALLFQFLGAAGNIMGSDAYVQVEGDRHPPRLFQVHVGRTSKGRKGTSWGRVKSLLETVAPVWIRARLASGLSSGEGVIYEVRDPVEERQKKKGKVETVVVDPGVTDKRLLVFEGEFAKALRSMERQGNTLSAVLRDCWDHGNLRTLIKNNPNRATGAHVGVIGHITDDELRRYLDRTEMANGLANRIIFVCVQRSKMLPRGGRPIDWSSIAQRLRHILTSVPQGQVHLTDAAWRIWEGVYPTLSADRPGMLGAILGRAEAQVIRLALIYALLDGSAFIDEPHLLAALACWDYAEASARYLFGDSLGDPVADEILRALRERPNGMARNELMNHFGRHLGSNQIGRALGVLAQSNFVVRDIERTTGRPVERWRAVK